MNENNLPKVSVCIPTYMGADLLGATIESVLSQNLEDFELIIIDDNSHDDTAAVVIRYNDSRIRFIQNSSNLGPEGNWNKCLEYARGRFFKLLPQDDLLLPTCLSKQVAILEQDAEQHLAFTFSARRIIDSNGRILTTRGYTNGKEGIIPGNNIIRHCLRFGTNLIGEPGGVLFRTDVARQIGNFSASEPYVIDLDYWFRLLQKGDAHYIPNPLVAFRVSKNQWSVVIGSKQSTDFNRFIDRVSNNKNYSISQFDIVLGKLMARINNFARLIFYHVILK